jgi:DNA-binding NarL/FixJ family response regulator
MNKKSINKGTRIKRSLAQSTYITAVWNWFMILAGKAAEPVLVTSVLYASVKLLPVVHFPPQFDVAVFIAQFVALDIGGLSLNKLADQAKKDGNDTGATHARRLSIALVGVMLIGVIMAGVDQIIKIEGQVGTVIDTILLIARAVMAVLYSRVIHSLKNDDEPEPPSEEQIDEIIEAKVNVALAGSLEILKREIVSQLNGSLSQHLDERLAELDAKQASAMARLKDEQATMITETVTSMVEAGLRKRAAVPPAVSSPKVRSITEAASRKRATGETQEIDKVIWPLLNTGLSVRAIAAKVNTSPATVGRSRQRWIATQSVSVTNFETPEQVKTAERVI